MKCPKCSSVEMTEHEVEGVQVDTCPSCHGHWLDVFELDKLLAADARSLIAEDANFNAATGQDGPRLNCPRCKATYLIKLNSRRRPGVILDNCKVCFGTWLDAGELARLAGGGLQRFLMGLFT